MLKALIKKQLLEINSQFLKDRKTGKARSRAGVIGLAVGTGFAFLILAGCMYYIASMFGGATAELGPDYEWLYFSFMGILALVLGVFGSVFNTYAGLYLSKDNETLMAMPIPAGKLLASRLIGVMLMSLLYSSLVWIPTLVWHFVNRPLTPLCVIHSVLTGLLLAVLVTVLTCILGWLLAVLTQRFKGKSFLTVILSLVFIALYYYGYGKFMSYLQDASQFAGNMALTIKSRVWPLYILGVGAAGEVLPMLEFSALTIALFAVCAWVMSRSYYRIMATPNRVRKKRAKGYSAQCVSPGRALLKREFLRFTSSATYMLNCGLGLIILIVTTVLVCVYGKTLAALAEALEITEYIPRFAAAALCLFPSMNIISTPSVSLEGKGLWIVQSLPADPFRVLLAKLMLHFILNAAAALPCTIVLCAVLHVKAYQIALAACVVLLFILLSGAFGLVVGVKKPNLTWTNETTPIKQGLPVLLTLFGGMVLSLAMGAGAYFTIGILSSEGYLGALAALLAAADLLLLIWLRTRGARIFAHL